MNNINYKFLIGGLICILIAVLYLRRLKKNVRNENDIDLYSQSLNWEGFAGGLALLICGLVMILGEIKKLI